MTEFMDVEIRPLTGTNKDPPPRSIAYKNGKRLIHIIYPCYWCDLEPQQKADALILHAKTKHELILPSRPPQQPRPDEIDMVQVSRPKSYQDCLPRYGCVSYWYHCDISNPDGLARHCIHHKKKAYKNKTGKSRILSDEKGRRAKRPFLGVKRRASNAIDNLIESVKSMKF